MTEEVENKLLVISGVLKLLSKSRSIGNFFELVANENLRINSQSYFDEICNLKPQISYILRRNHHFCERHKVKTDRLEFYIENSYNADKLKISALMKKNLFSNSSFEIISFFAIVYMSQNSILKKFHKQFYIYPLQISEEVICEINDPLLDFNPLEPIQIQVRMKATHIATLLLNHLVYNFIDLYQDSKVNLLTKKNMEGVLKSKVLKQINQNEVAHFVGNWLLDDVNLSQNPLEVISIIDWKSCSIEILFEFVIKFASLIETLRLEDYFSDAIKYSLHNNTNQSIDHLN